MNSYQTEYAFLAQAIHVESNIHVEKPCPKASTFAMGFAEKPKKSVECQEITKPAYLFSQQHGVAACLF